MFTPIQIQSLVEPFGLDAAGLQHLGSSQNHVYRGQRPAGDPVIVRISEGRHRVKSEVEAELGWISHLVSRGLRICVPVPAVSGEWCIAAEVEGRECLVTCFRHAPGTKVVPALVDPALYRKLGLLVGELHAGAVSFGEVGADWERTHWHESRLIGHDFDALGEQLSAVFRSSVSRLVDELRTWPAAPSTYGPVHGDISFGNCFVESGELWIFDFDNCEHGYFLQDLATVLYDSIYCKVLNKFADDGLTGRMVPLWRAFLEGYAETGVVKTMDPEALRKFFLLREAVIYGHYHRILDVATLNDSFKAGLEVMRQNVEQQEHQVDFKHLFT